MKVDRTAADALENIGSVDDLRIQDGLRVAGEHFDLVLFQIDVVKIEEQMLYARYHGRFDAIRRHHGHC